MKIKSKRKNGATARITLDTRIFLIILAWSIVSTTLLLLKFTSESEPGTQQRPRQSPNNNNNNGRKKRSNEQYRFDNARKFAGKLPRRVKDKIHHRDDPTDPRPERRNNDNNGPLRRGGGSAAASSVSQFPFTRNLERFSRSANFYLYVVDLSPHRDDEYVDSPPSTHPLRWSEVPWKELVVNWGRATTFSDLLEMSTPLENDTKESRRGGGGGGGGAMMRKKLILHCLPKAASTTLRRACYKNQKESCPAIDFPVQQDPFGYRKIDDFFRAVRECDEIDHFCVQGGDANMSVINHRGDGDEEEEEEKEERDPFHFVHMVPFRNFDDWVESAIKHIHDIDGNCDRIDHLLTKCLGYRELYMELYPKSVLSLLTGMAFDANKFGGGASNRGDRHHIMLYNYKDADGVVTEVSDFFGMDRLPRTDVRHKEKKDEGEETCPRETSETFHRCHDGTLANADAIRGLEAERKRRKTNDRMMKRMFFRNQEGSET